MDTNKKIEGLLQNLRLLATVEQTPPVILLREKLPKLIEQYEKTSKIEENLMAVLQEYEESLNNANKNLDDIDRELNILLSDKQS